MNPAFLIFTLCSGLALSISASYAATSAFILQGDYHISPIVYGWITLTVGVIAMLSKLMNTQMSKRLGIHSTLKIGLVMVLIAGVLMEALHLVGLLPMIVLMFCVLSATLGQNLIGPNATACALSPFKQIAGSAGALYNSAQMLISFVISGTVAAFSNFGISALRIAFILIGSIGFIVANRSI